VAGRRRTARVFTSPEGQALEYANLRRRVFNVAVEQAGLADEDDRLTMHDLRHYACTAWLDEGISAHQVMRWMGHGDVRVTMRYAHETGAAAQAARGMVR